MTRLKGPDDPLAKSSIIRRTRRLTVSRLAISPRINEDTVTLISRLALSDTKGYAFQLLNNRESL